MQSYTESTKKGVKTVIFTFFGGAWIGVVQEALLMCFFMFFCQQQESPIGNEPLFSIEKGAVR